MKSEVNVATGMGVIVEQAWLNVYRSYLHWYTRT